MARGPALVDDLLPVLDAALTEDIDGYATQRLGEMKEHYAEFIERRRALSLREADGPRRP